MIIPPDDIRKRAKELDDEFWNQNVPQGSEDFVMDFIIKGMMEERERCAKIAEDMYLDMMHDKDMRGVRERHEWVCRDIASAIRGTS